MARKPKASDTFPTLSGFKGFDANLKCRDFQYEIGRTYTLDGKPARCTSQGFHAVEMPLDAWNYYAPGSSRFASVIASGEVDKGENDTKFAAASITITAEVTLSQFIKSAVDWIISKAAKSAATGHSGHAAATGKHAIAASLGVDATACAGTDGWIVLAAWHYKNNEYQIAKVKAAKVGGPEGIKAGMTYRLATDGVFVEVV